MAGESSDQPVQLAYKNHWLSMKYIQDSAYITDTYADLYIPLLDYAKDRFPLKQLKYLCCLIEESVIQWLPLEFPVEISQQEVEANLKFPYRHFSEDCLSDRRTLLITRKIDFSN